MGPPAHSGARALAAAAEAGEEEEEWAISKPLAQCIILVVTVCLVLFLQWGTRQLERLVRRHKHVSDMLSMMYRELMVLGMVAFMLFVLLEAGVQLSEQVKHVFEVIHNTLFVVALLYSVFVITLAAFSNAQSKLWAAFQRLDAGEVERIRSLREPHAGVLRRAITAVQRRWRVARRRELLLFHALRARFIREHGLGDTFCFATYLKKCKQHVFLDLVEVRDSVWFAVAGVGSLDIFARGVLPAYRAVEDPTVHVIVVLALTVLATGVVHTKIARTFGRIMREEEGRAAREGGDRRCEFYGNNDSSSRDGSRDGSPDDGSVHSGGSGNVKGSDRKAGDSGSGAGDGAGSRLSSEPGLDGGARKCAAEQSEAGAGGSMLKRVSFGHKLSHVLAAAPEDGDRNQWQARRARELFWLGRPELLLRALQLVCFSVAFHTSVTLAFGYRASRNPLFPVLVALLLLAYASIAYLISQSMPRYTIALHAGGFVDASVLQVTLDKLSRQRAEEQQRAWERAHELRRRQRRQRRAWERARRETEGQGSPLAGAGSLLRRSWSGRRLKDRSPPLTPPQSRPQSLQRPALQHADVSVRTAAAAAAAAAAASVAAAATTAATTTAAAGARQPVAMVRGKSVPALHLRRASTASDEEAAAKAEAAEEAGIVAGGSNMWRRMGDWSRERLWGADVSPRYLPRARTEPSTPPVPPRASFASYSARAATSTAHAQAAAAPPPPPTGASPASPLRREQRPPPAALPPSPPSPPAGAAPPLCSRFRHWLMCTEPDLVADMPPDDMLEDSAGSAVTIVALPPSNACGARLRRWLRPPWEMGLDLRGLPRKVARVRRARAFAAWKVDVISVLVLVDFFVVSLSLHKDVMASLGALVFAVEMLVASCFLLELLIEMWYYGVLGFFTNSVWNCFDFMVVMASCLLTLLAREKPYAGAIVSLRLVRSLVIMGMARAASAAAVSRAAKITDDSSDSDDGGPADEGAAAEGGDDDAKGSAAVHGGSSAAVHGATRTAVHGATSAAVHGATSAAVHGATSAADTAAPVPARVRAPADEAKWPGGMTGAAKSGSQAATPASPASVDVPTPAATSPPRPTLRARRQSVSGAAPRPGGAQRVGTLPAPSLTALLRRAAATAAATCSMRLSAASFQPLVLESPDPWLVKFYTKWSMPCQRLDLKWPGMAEALREHVRVGEVDADLHPSVAEACGVAQFPSLKMFPAGVKGYTSGVTFAGSLHRSAVLEFVTAELQSGPMQHAPPPAHLRRVSAARRWKKLQSTTAAARAIADAPRARSIRQGHILPALSPLRVRRAGCVGGTHGAPRTAQEMRAVELFDGRVVVLFGVEGAYVDDAVLRDFVRHASALRSKGVDEIVCISVNDEHVLREWFREHQALHSVSFVADWDAQVSTELGAAQHHSSARLGMRCRRFAAVVANGIVAAVVPASDAMAPRAGCDLATLLLETL